MNIGILSLQGAVDDHRTKLSELGVNPVTVRTKSDLNELDGLIIPGGESSTMIKIIHKNDLWDELKTFSQTKSCWGICAGLILLAKNVSSPKQESFGSIDIDVKRNAYGRQLNSFITPDLKFSEKQGKQISLEGVFIRAPQITRVGASVKTLITHNEQAVLVEEGLSLGSSFHPERSEGHTLHKYFLEKINRTNR